jgi:hypothetical protein
VKWNVDPSTIFFEIARPIPLPVERSGMTNPVPAPPALALLSVLSAFSVFFVFSVS